jgi:succinyl-CoA synthetase beta subunit
MAEIDFPIPAIVKAQAFTTSRYAKGLIQFADTPAEIHAAARELGGRTVDGFPVTEVLVEERLEIEHEYFFSYYIDDAAATARFLFSASGGSGVEQAVSDRPTSVQSASVSTVAPLRVHRVRETLRRGGVHGRELLTLAEVIVKAVRTAIAVEARSLEINPIVRTADGRHVAADCRITVDDYAVFRHPELQVDIARDFPHPPSRLDRIAYAAEEHDYRGTFYFVQLATDFTRNERYVGFHGSGGGGSMMSMDALSAFGFAPANYCDTSGNPPASKAYRAARIIASQPGIVAYFGSGSGVASQEQVHSARGLVKAFLEIGMTLPVVMRLGGNMEDEAIAILERYTRSLSAPVRGFGKDATVSECVAELDRLVRESQSDSDAQTAPSRAIAPRWLSAPETYRFSSLTGEVHYHHPKCLACTTKACVRSCVPQILRLTGGVPELAISREAAKRGRCIECLACEVECREHGAGGGYIHLPIVGLAEEAP